MKTDLSAGGRKGSSSLKLTRLQPFESNANLQVNL